MDDGALVADVGGDGWDALVASNRRLPIDSVDHDTLSTFSRHPWLAVFMLRYQSSTIPVRDLGAVVEISRIKMTGESLHPRAAFDEGRACLYLLPARTILTQGSPLCHDLSMVIRICIWLRGSTSTTGPICKCRCCGTASIYPQKSILSAGQHSLPVWEHW